MSHPRFNFSFDKSHLVISETTQDEGYTSRAAAVEAAWNSMCQKRLDDITDALFARIQSMVKTELVPA